MDTLKQNTILFSGLFLLIFASYLVAFYATKPIDLTAISIGFYVIIYSLNIALLKANKLLIIQGILTGIFVSFRFDALPAQILYFFITLSFLIYIILKNIRN